MLDDGADRRADHEVVGGWLGGRLVCGATLDSSGTAEMAAAEGNMPIVAERE